jgi:glycosyltransferase involved in cell wall biosynthesis
MWCHNLRGIQKGFVDDLIFVAKHTARISQERGEIGGAKVHIIPHGIDLNKFTFKERTPTKKIAWIGRYDANKNFYKALDILMELPSDYELHACGRRQLANWEEAYFDDRVTRNGLKVFYTADEPDINKWLEDKEFYLLTSGKEAFSYSTAEAMAKGIKPIIHHFYAAPEIYPEKYIFDKNSDAVKMILSDEYNEKEYREFIEKNYPIKKFFEEYDKLLL